MGMVVDGASGEADRKFIEPYFVVRFKDVEGDDDRIIVAATLDISPEFLGDSEEAEGMRDLLRNTLREISQNI